MNTAPLFIVGAPRSGTTLLSAMMNAHSRIKCGPETQFFNKLGEEQIKACLEDSQWPKMAVNSMLSLTISNQFVYKLLGLTETQMMQSLKSKNPTVKAMLEIFTDVDIGEQAKPRWAEKTPNHLLHLNFVRKHFPDSPVIRILRDPRDSAKSINRLPWASDNAVVNAFLVEDWYEVSRDFFEKDSNSISIKYEDLIVDPKGELSKICDHIGEEFEDSMLNTSESGKAVQTQNEPWKNQVSASLDPTRSYAWKKNKDQKEVLAMGIICSPMIEECGYESNHKVSCEKRIFPYSQDFLEANLEEIITTSLQGVRLTKSPSNKADEIKILKTPSHYSWKRKLKYYFQKKMKG